MRAKALSQRLLFPFFCALFCSLSSAPGVAVEIVDLFERTPVEGGVLPVGNYSALVQRVEDGDILRFPDGSQYLVISRLDGNHEAGNTSVVFEVRRLRPASDSRQTTALRLNRSGASYTSSSLNYVQHTLRAFPALEQSNAPAVKLVRGSEFYAEVERISADPGSLFDFLTAIAKDPRLAELPENAEKIGALKRFARQTAGISRLKDAGPRQIVFDRDQRRWVLLDWMDEAGHSTTEIWTSASAVEARSLFLEHEWNSHVPGTSELSKEARERYGALIESLDAETKAERAKVSSQPAACVTWSLRSQLGR